MVWTHGPRWNHDGPRWGQIGQQIGQIGEDDESGEVAGRGSGSKRTRGKTRIEAVVRV